MIFSYEYDSENHMEKVEEFGGDVVEATAKSSMWWVEHIIIVIDGEGGAYREEITSWNVWNLMNEGENEQRGIASSH
jgi:hypothetical protein